MRWLITTLLVIMLICGCSGSSSGKSADNPLRNVAPTDSDGKYSTVLKQCVVVKEVDDGCDLNTLPLLGMETPNPDKDAVMSRLLVSHAWMADRFSQLLDVLPDSVFPMFKSVTAIVIDDNTKPSFYRPITAAIYIDPNFLWLNSTEKSTIDNGEDFRSDFGADLQFRFLGRYVIDNDYAFTGSNASSRTLDDILLSFARMLFHELSHAVDRAPPEIFSILDITKPVALSLYDQLESWATWKLYVSLPLLDEELKDLAAVRYSGELATEHQMQLKADYVGALMENDRATHLYNYSNLFEDTAMLFEASLMKFHFNADFDVAVVDKPEVNLCENYIVSWGVRNRLSLAKVKARALVVVPAILPDYTDWDEFFAATAGEPTNMVTGASWCNNLVLASPGLLGGSQLKFLKEKAGKLDKRAVNKSDIAIPYL